MTFEEYIANPLGKNNAVMSAVVREAIRSDYTKRFDNLLLRENGQIKYAMYKEKDNLFVHIKIPSEVVKDFYYDVVLKFMGVSLTKRINECETQFFSNDPAFVFTYAYVFQQNKLFIPELKSKMSKQALREKPREKNREELLGYVKSLYFSYLFMKQRGLFNPIQINSATNFDQRWLLSNIMDADLKVQLRQEEGAKVSKAKKVEVSKNVAKKIDRLGVNDKAKDRLVIKTSDKMKVKRTLPSLTSKTTNSTRTTKKTGINRKKK